MRPLTEIKRKKEKEFERWARSDRHDELHSNLDEDGDGKRDLDEHDVLVH